MYLFYEMLWSSTMIFLYCEIGEKVTHGFNEISHEIGQIDWYLFPIEQLKFLPTIISVVQQPMHFSGFGSISYTREDFKKVQISSQFFFSPAHG